jgi:murein DD-endopeptidase MepM/ murein hydrolase activator NlpD
MGLWTIGSASYLLFHDDMVAVMMRRQTEMQFRYEDRLAGLRTRIQNVTSHASAERTLLEAKLDELGIRQAQLESRALVVEALAERANGIADPTNVPSRPRSQPTSKTAQSKPTAPATPNPLLSGMNPDLLPSGVSTFAPLPPASLSPREPMPFNGRKQTEEFELKLRPGQFPATEGLPDARPPARETITSISPDDTSSGAFISQRLKAMTYELDRIERDQMRILTALHGPAVRETARIHSVLTEAGLAADSLDPPPARTRPGQKASKDAPVGGPFVPVQVTADGSLFQELASNLQSAILKVDRLWRIMPFVPLRKPLPGPLDVTSGFGARIDPFLGRLALHTGIDIKNDYGAAVHATAAGKVISAGPEGGYGNMVEIDHGNGLTTRYAHLSSAVVSEGQQVEAGSIIGRIGASGRATGPHLHYETRIDGEPVDPARFLKAGGRLFPDG